MIVHVRWSLVASASAWIACSLGSGCASEDPDGGPSGALELRPGVEVVARLERGSHESYAESYGGPQIWDVARDGDRWAALVMDYRRTGWQPADTLPNAYLLHTEDGAAWALDTLLPETFWEGSEYPWGIFFSEGSLYVVYSSTSGRSTVYTLHRASFGDGVVTAATANTVVRALSFGARGGEVGSMAMSVGDPAYIHFTHFASPGATPETVIGERPGSTPDCDPVVWVLRPGVPGGPWSFAGDCGNVDAGGDGMWCAHFATAPFDTAPRVTCAPLPSEGPWTTGAVGTPWASGSFVGRIYADEGRVRATQVRADGLRVFEIGEGELVRGEPGSIRGKQLSRYGDLLGLTQDLPDERIALTLHRFSRATDDFAPVDLPTRPCTDDGECGYRVRNGGAPLEWAEPLGGGEYQMFYVVDESSWGSNERRFVFLTSRERIPDEAPPSARLPAGELERACARAVIVAGEGTACHGAVPSFESCVQSGLERDALPVEQRAWIDRVLTAASCDDLRAPHEGEPCSDEGERSCLDGAWLACVGGTRAAIGPDCAARGATCALDELGEPGCVIDACAGLLSEACLGTTVCGSSIDEACGADARVCTAEGGFAPSCAVAVGGCAAAGETVCDGSRGYTCTGPGFGQPRADCDGVPGLRCDPLGCAPTSPNCEPGEVARCDGDALVYCLYNTLRELDCRSIGGRCAPDPLFGATCR